MKDLYGRYRYEMITACAGAIVMIWELIGARMIAPFFGTSIYVWTAMIGVILGALSFGYWYGGRLADRFPTDQMLMRVIVLAAGCVLVALTLQETLLSLAAQNIPDVRAASLLAALVLFAPAALLLGIVSPYVARLRLASIKTAGTSIGRLYAAGTFGSILGTFAAGYFLVAWFGNRHLGLGIVFALVALSLLVSVRGWMALRIGITAAAFVGIFATTPLFNNVIADIDTPYSRYLVTETTEEPRLRSLITDPFSAQSGQYVGQPDALPFGYTRAFFTLHDELKPDNSLLIGGGAFTFPLAAVRAYPDAEMTVVEIDPALLGVAKQYFSYKDSSKITIVHEDGRVYLNKAASKRFGVVYMDAFSSLTPPYQLTTKETAARLKDVAKKDGVVIVNAIAEGSGSPYLSALLAGYETAFTSVKAYQVDSRLPVEARQNLIVVATDSKDKASRAASIFRGEALGVAVTAPFTDDYAPVEQLINTP